MTASRERFDSASYELAAEALGVALREAAAAATTPERLALEADRLRRAVAQSRPARRIRPGLVYSLAAAALGATLSLGAYWLAKPGAAPLALEAEVCGAPNGGKSSRVFRPAGRHYVAACERQSTELRFADGSRVGVDADARLRVQDLYANGASLLLEKGRANVQVVHRSKHSRWTVAAGPFAVTVTGTRFDIAWEPAGERLSVELFEGQVEIEGPNYSSAATLKAGQRFEASSSDPRWSITPLGGAASKPESVPTSDTATEAAKLEPPKGTSDPLPTGTSQGARLNRASAPRQATESDGHTAPSTSLPSAGEGRQWSKLVAAGEFTQVTREADTMGLMVCLSQCSASDLRALADASRYTGRLDTAEAALRVLHDKFAAQSTTAAYLLGVVDEARGRNVSALRWYDEYLSRIPSGGFVAEARAARLRMLVATGGRTAAKQAARDYLEQYPKGAAAGLARQVLENR
jgi:tetratricopeptide (TPR) repeat protein